MAWFSLYKMVILSNLTIKSMCLGLSLLHRSSNALEARRLAWELEMFQGLWVTQADVPFLLFPSESHTDNVWLSVSSGPLVSIIFSTIWNGVDNLD